MEKFIKEQKERLNDVKKSSLYKRSKKFREETKRSEIALEHFAHNIEISEF